MFAYTIRRTRDTGTYTRTICLLLALLMQTAFLRAQHNNRPDYQLLWRIDAPGMQAPSYLFGTMHLTDRRVFEFSDSVLTALRSTASFAMEVDMDSMLAYMLAPNGPLKDTVNHMRRLLSDKEYHYVDSLVKEKTGAPLDQLSLKRLWFLEKLLIGEEEELKKNESRPGHKPENVFLDAWLYQKAIGLNKPVHSLEKIQNQLNIMSAEVSDIQKEAFLWALGYKTSGTGDATDRTKRLQSRVDYLDAMVNHYYEGDLQQILKLVDSWEEEDTHLELVPRNIEMADNLARLAAKGSVFAAVGVAHLPGGKGMLALLREKGYTVTPVNATFTGVARRERQQLDSVKGYSLNRMADGYSVVFPGIPIAYQVPNMNRKMYVGTNNDETGFAFFMDIAQLAADKQELVNNMIANMASQGNAAIQRSYPIIYRDIPGTEALMLRENMLFHMRLFIRNNRVFVFMYNSQEKDSVARKDFFNSVRFYDVVHPVMAYETLARPDLGFSAILPADANHASIGGRNGGRPEEVYTSLDGVNNVSYVVRILKMHKGYYNLNDQQLLEELKQVLIGKDSTIQVIDSSLSEQGGLPRHQLTWQHANGFVSRIDFIPRGNLAYCLMCVYDKAHTDSSYWRRFLDEFRILPLLSQAPSVPFTPEDSSFSVMGPVALEGGALSRYDSSSAVATYQYQAMDTLSNAVYIVMVDKYHRYYYEAPDSIFRTFLQRNDSDLIVTASRQYTLDGLPVREVETKLRRTGLRLYRKAVLAGHTVYRISAIIPEELDGKGYAQQFFASFHPGKREQNDARRLGQKKLDLLLADLQSRDSAVFQGAFAYLRNLAPDSAEVPVMLHALTQPFPGDTGSNNVKVKLLLSLKKHANDATVHAAGQLFNETTDPGRRRSILRFLSALGTDTAMHTFLRLGTQLQESIATGGVFDYSLRWNDSLYQRYLPEIVAAAEHAPGLLEAFAGFSAWDSTWLAPRFERYGLERLVPGLQRLFTRDIARWKNRQPDADSSWMWENSLLNIGHILALPGMPGSTVPGFRVLLTDTTMQLRALGARGLISQHITVNDIMLNSILINNNVSWPFISDLRDRKQLKHIQHLLNQELIGRSYVASILSDDYDVTAIGQFARVKVKLEDQPAVWITLYRYKTDENEEWEYVLNGPQPADGKKLNFEPTFIRWLNEGQDVTDKKQLAAITEEAYKRYLEEQKEQEQH
ncbi:TraB/GumN family protein [uncultured Chitinophaga sp.]|jgi:Uncharacterized protein conserved in bacteria|uniref:TraB/GumN family protein n=1 Tax=uncultured Chitinophaga sp. TaxID=339340 RepID=UPI00262FCF9B|nr:TraB/GumN family protein [uncultured Chitinophaga sp.]